jgi:hypothetical protein
VEAVFCLQTELGLGFCIISCLWIRGVVFRRVAGWVTIIFRSKLELCVHR